jgi:MoaA/NifB/PqqE/SkfB family radical SAM enzyme
LSITSCCNLKCSGCYAEATGTTRLDKNLKIDQWEKIIREASELGVFGFVIAGGESFLYPELLNICKEFKDHFFIILTNRTLIEKKDYKKLKKLGNIAILISIEGDRELTNKRRGEGVYESDMNAIKHLNKYGVLNGISVTITRLNYAYWMNPNFIDELISKGIKISVFIEYIPLTPIQDGNLSNRCMSSNIFSSRNIVK